MKQYNEVGSYEARSQFSSAKKMPNAGFGSASSRFGQLGVGNSPDKNYAPTGSSYYGTNFTGMMGKDAPNENRDNKNRTASHSFGIGRENMRKLHVEKIIL